MLPLSFKKGPGRPRRLRFRELYENGSRTRRPGVSYRRTKCNKIGHNSRKCQSKEENPAALKRKRKTPRVKPANTNGKVDELAVESAVDENAIDEPAVDYFHGEIDASIEAMVASIEAKYQENQSSQIVNLTPNTTEVVADTMSPKKKQRMASKKKSVSTKKKKNMLYNMLRLKLSMMFVMHIMCLV
ncbi:unnamed protein product [Lathyrus sativus]|nr:unnamed protein product [Lathyrus sativus]